MKKHFSRIWLISKEDLINIVKSSTTIKQILSSFNLENKGSNYKTLKHRLKEDNIDYSHIKLGLGNNLGRKKSNKKIPLSEILVVNSTYNRSNLRERLLKEGLLENKCSECGQGPLWNNKVLVLQLDHINGISDDNRIENLRILCPHCHSQTDNFAGKNKRKIGE